jgi:hypothetical protein
VTRPAAAPTAGPWFVGETIGGRQPAVIGDGDSVVAILPGNWNFCTENDADTRLIAAAPDLRDELAQLVRLLEPMERDGSLNVPGLATLNGARAALAKAGEP